jgi:hypothetical protein
MLVRIIDALKGMSTSPELVTLTPMKRQDKGQRGDGKGHVH